MTQSARIDVETLLRHLGIVATMDRASAHRWIGVCPNPEHSDSEPSWSIVDRPGHRKHASHHCFTCKFNGGPWELAAAVWGVELRVAGARLREVLGEGQIPDEAPRVVIRQPRHLLPFKLPLGSVIPGPGGRWFGPALEYLEGRRVTREQIDRWGFGYAIRGRLANRVIVPVWTEGKLRTFSARAIAPGLERYEAGRRHEGARPKRALWGEPGFDPELGIATVAEGVWSGLALERAGAPNPCAMLGSDLTPARARILGGFDALLVATDPDKAGEAVAAWIAVLGRRATVRRLDLPTAPDDCSPEVLEEVVKKTLDTLGWKPYI